MDADGNGELTVDELVDGFARLQLPVRIEEEHIRALVACADQDGNGVVSYDEILHLFGTQAQDYAQRRQLHDAVLKLAVFCFFLVPLGCVVTGLVFGVMLALFEVAGVGGR